MNGYNEYYQLMSRYTQYFEEVREKEKQKFEALLTNNLEKIETALSDHQSAVKKVQSFEKQRIELSERLGFGDRTFSEICSLYSGDEKHSLILLKNRLESAVKIVKYFNKKSLEVSNMQIQYYEELAASSGEDAHYYNSQGKTDSSMNKSKLLNTKA